MLVSFFPPGMAVAQQSAAPRQKENPSSAAAPAPAGEQPAETAATEEELREKEKMANVALVLLVGIASAGILLIAGVLIWGSRVRRISRQRDSSAPLDPLWYLRGSPPLETGSTTPEAEPATEAATDERDPDAGPPTGNPAEPPPSA